jgi:hypothetical protein
MLGAWASEASGAPSVSAPTVSPSSVPVGESTQILVTSQITTDPPNPLIANGVRLLRVDAANKVVATLGTMRDDGTQGDAVAGDGTLTLRVTVNEAAAGEVRLRVSAAFRGLLKRVLSSPTVVTVESAGALRVPPLTPILDSIPDLDTGDPLVEAEISEDAAGRRIVRTKLEIVFHSTITAGDANRVLAAFNAVPTSAIAGTRAIVVRIPDPGSLSALAALVEQIESDPAVWFVKQAYFSAANETPQEFDANPAALVAIDHHLAARAHGAWVARNLVADAPPVIAMDFFGAGAPNSDLGAALTASDYGSETLEAHGYHVLGILAGTFGGTGLRGLVTGTTPSPVNLRAVDLQVTSPLDNANRFVQRAQALLATTSGRAVANTSIGFTCQPGLAPYCLELPHVRHWAVLWIEKVRAAGLEDRVLHLTSAGNIDEAGVPVMDAATNSEYSGAALRSDLVDESTGSPVPPLANTLVIENDVGSQVGSGPFRVQCLSADSFVGGHLGAIGEQVWSFTDASSSAGYLSGTSMSTPQVAGLAAYLWALKPELTVQEVKAILLSTAQPVPVSSEAGCSTHQNPSPIIDAYAAVLALDRHEALTGADLSLARIRGNLLDISDSVGAGGSDGQFTEYDLSVWTSILAAQPALLDYSRYDLNGDGFTGGASTARFDLDINNPIPTYAVLDQDVDGIPIFFDEHALSDAEILCYYAYSPLYTGDTDVRAAVLGPEKCRAVQLDVALSEFSGSDAGLDVKLTDAAGEPLAGVLIQFQPTGGTVNPPSATTDENGMAQAIVTLDTGSSGVSIEVTALGTAGQILDREIVTGGTAILGVTPESISSPVTDMPIVINVYVEGPGGLVPLPNVWLDITATGGTIGASGGYTNFFGDFETTVRSDAKSLCVLLDVTAREIPAGPVLGSRQAELLVDTPGLDNLTTSTVFGGLAYAEVRNSDGSTSSAAESGAVGLSRELACPPPAGGVQQVALAASVSSGEASVTATQSLRLEADDSVSQILVHADGAGSEPATASESSLLGSFRVTEPLSVAFTPQVSVGAGGSAWVYLTRTQHPVYGIPGLTDDVQACIRASSTTGTGACSSAGWPTGFTGTLPPGLYYVYAGTISDSSWVLDMTITLAAPP